MNTTETAPKPPKITWGPVTAVIVSVVVFILSQIIGGFLIGLVAYQTHHDAASAQAWFEHNVWAQFFFFAAAQTLTLGLLYLYLRRRKASFYDLGLNKPRLGYVWKTLVGFGVYIMLYLTALVLATKAFPSLNVEQKQELGFSTTTQGATLWLIFISLVILPPLAEETVARGFLYGGLRTKLTAFSATIVTSVLFAMPHLAEGDSGGLLWVAGIDTFILSIVLCRLREKTGSLWPGIGVHMLKNGLAFIVLFHVLQNFK